MDINQRLFDMGLYATAVVTPGATTVCEVLITLRNANGAPRGPASFDVFLSDSAVGAGVTAVTASGTVACKTAGTLGTDIAVLIAKKYLTVQCLANGNYTLSITDSAKTAFKVCAHIAGVTQVLATLATASYGP